jgi:hypothetical protein
MGSIVANTGNLGKGAQHGQRTGGPVVDCAHGVVL